MKIVVTKRLTPRVPVRDLAIGDVFRYEGSEVDNVYMRVQAGILNLRTGKDYPESSTCVIKLPNAYLTTGNEE